MGIPSARVGASWCTGGLPSARVEEAPRRNCWPPRASRKRPPIQVERQFKADPSLLDPNSDSLPDYDACVAISTKASLREMIAPAALVMLTPLVAGTFFGVEAVFGILTGGLVSGVQLAISMSNSGGAWDNAKKYISGGFDPDPALRKKDGNGNSTPAHDAAVTGDTVGDPFKDTSGPALNILMKLMAILSLVFAQYFESINGGKGLFKL